MSHKIIKVPKGIEYISQVEEIKTIYNNDLPHNSVINKQLTGIGGTSLVLTNDQPYIIAVNLVEMIQCKVKQKDIYPNVLGVYGDITLAQIQEYVLSGGKKIMVTYDSIPKVKEALGKAMCQKFRLLVDEFHTLINYLGEFKPLVAIKLLEHSTEFKSVSYLTATPTDYEFLPSPMKSLDIVEFDWLGKVTPNIKHSYIKEGMSERVLSTLLHYLDNTTNEMYIFYNSRASVVSVLKKLFKCKKNLTLNDVNILFSKSDNNEKYFKKHLGTKFKHGEVPNGENNKRINFISSMAFEGIDFFPNHLTNALPVTLIVSDPDVKSTRYDINVEVRQIFGRFRKNKITGLRVPDHFLYFWNTTKSEYSLTKTEFLAKLKKDREGFKKHLEIMKDNESTLELTVQALKYKRNTHLLLDDGVPILHPYSIEAEMTQYGAIHSDPMSINNLDSDDDIKDDSQVLLKLLNLDPNASTYTVPLLTAEYTKALGRTPSVKKLIDEYESILQDIEENQNDEIVLSECKDQLDNFLICNPLFNEWIMAGLTLSRMRSLGLVKSKISEEAIKSRTLNCNVSEVKAQLNLEIGSVYTSEELLEKVKEIYNTLNIQVDKPKSTDIKKWYEISTSSKRIDGKPKKAYKIVKAI